MINRRQQKNACDSDSSYYEFVVHGKNHSPNLKVHGHAFIQNPDQLIDSCSPVTPVLTKHRYNFNQVQSVASNISKKLASMFPNWTLNDRGVIIRLEAEGIHLNQPYNLFTLPAICHGKCKLEELFFDCHLSHDCKVPREALSHVASNMLLGEGAWTGPVDQTYPQDKLVIFNIPVADGQAIDISTDNPSAGLNACNTVYHFYAVDQEGRYASTGNFTVRRSSKYPLSGMILAPQGIYTSF
ncbi:hypothetical protein BD560DRAFT_401517 [Blakeslea trispora]|nr:hypothetical protein BD560DRAFT_401517 [Blakeslea trispora]